MNINFTLIVQMVVFGMLVLITMKWIWPPILKAMDERAQKIAQGLAAAEKGERSLAEARGNADVVIREARERRRLRVIAGNPSRRPRAPPAPRVRGSWLQHTSRSNSTRARHARACGARSPASQSAPPRSSSDARSTRARTPICSTSSQHRFKGT